MNKNNNDQNRKKSEEEKVLKNIYSKNCKFTSTEKPDFIIEVGNETLGAEITSFFYNETTARLKKIRGYNKKILNSTDDSVLDKRDKGWVSKALVYLDIYGKWYFLGNMISVKFSKNKNKNILPDYKEIEEKILQIINKKNIKSEKYQKLDYLELIIKDEETIPFNISERISKSEKILKAVLNSKFKRLYFLSKKNLFVYGENADKNINRCANLSVKMHEQINT